MNSNNNIPITPPASVAKAAAAAGASAVGGVAAAGARRPPFGGGLTPPASPGSLDPLAEHRASMAQENEMLDQLHASVTQTQHKALRIGQEMKDQDPMLAQLGDNIDHSNMEVLSQNRSLTDMLKDSKERSFYGTVCVLVLIIVVLLWI